MAVIGVGHLGQAHARVLASLPEVDLVGVADVNPAQAEAVAQRHKTQAFTHFGPLIEAVDAACIVVPTCHHHATASAFLEHGVHLLIEKPLAPSVEEADAIVQSAERHGCIVSVGHIERFNPAFEAVAAKPIRPKYIKCERHGPFTGRSMDIGAVLDLMIHDLDLVAVLDHSAVIGVEAMGISLLGGHEDLVNARLRFADGCIADLTASRVAPTTKRTMQIWAPEGFAGIDFMTRKVTLMQPSLDFRQHGLKSATFDAGVRDAIKAELFGRHLQMREITCEAPFDQLTNELRHFVECVRTGRQPRVTAQDGRNAVTLGCRVLESLREHAWNGDTDGPRGANHFPPPIGPLFEDPRLAA
jgi:predicted dehydrogenase